MSEHDASYRHYFDAGCTNPTGMSGSISAMYKTPYPSCVCTVHVDQSGSTSSNMYCWSCGADGHRVIEDWACSDTACGNCSTKTGRYSWTTGTPGTCTALHMEPTGGAPMDLYVQVSAGWLQLEEYGCCGSPLSKQDASYRHYFDAGCTNAAGMSGSISAVYEMPYPSSCVCTVHVDQSGSTSSNMYCWSCGADGHRVNEDYACSDAACGSCSTKVGRFSWTAGTPGTCTALHIKPTGGALTDLYMQVSASWLELQSASCSRGIRFVRRPKVILPDRSAVASRLKNQFGAVPPAAQPLSSLPASDRALLVSRINVSTVLATTTIVQAIIKVASNESLSVDAPNTTEPAVVLSNLGNVAAAVVQVCVLSLWWWCPVEEIAADRFTEQAQCAAREHQEALYCGVEEVNIVR